MLKGAVGPKCCTNCHCIMTCKGFVHETLSSFLRKTRNTHKGPLAAATNNKQPNSNQQPKQPTTKINAQNKHTTPTPVIPFEVSCSETRWIPYYGGSDREGSCWQLGDPGCRQDWSCPNPTNCGETLASWLTPKSRLHHPNRKPVSSVPHVWKVLLLFQLRQLVVEPACWLSPGKLE